MIITLYNPPEMILTYITGKKFYINGETEFISYDDEKFKKEIKQEKLS